MFFKKKKIADLLKENIIWQRVNVGEFISSVDKVECRLRMNDFPDEPMYTLMFKGESIDFDDKPANWEIPLFRQS